MTVHKAKGLEFDTVFIIDAMEDKWRPRSGGRKPPANLPLKPYGDDFDDYVRLMYVAATRAKHTLIITSYYMDHMGKELLPSVLVTSALPTTVIKPEQADDPVEVLEQTLRWPRLNSKNERAMLSSYLEKYRLSVTHLLNFLNTTKGGPEYFFERNILRLPDIKTASLAHGTAMHAALETAQKLINTNKFDLSVVLDHYEKSLRNEHLPLTEHGRYIDRGQTIIRRLFENYNFKLPKGSHAEQRISDIRLGSAVIGGKLDRIDAQDKDNLVIVDYKTGKPLSSFSTTDQTKAIKAWNQRTQLIFYTLLAKNSPRFRFYKNIEGRMIYIEADSQRNLQRSYWPQQQELDRLEVLIQAVWRHICDLDFPNVSSYTSDYTGIHSFEDDLINGRI